MEGHGRHGSIGRSFGIAVAGLGEGKGLVKGLMGHPELTVVAVCDTDPQRVEAARRQFGVPHGDTEVSATLARPEVDILGRVCKPCPCAVDVDYGRESRRVDQ